MNVFKEGGGNVVDLINYTSDESDFTSLLIRIQRFKTLLQLTKKNMVVNLLWIMLEDMTALILLQML